jgi:hypothetical protein
MVANTGTYLDSPFHRYADGKDLSELALEHLADLEAVVVRWNVRQGRAIGLEVLKVETFGVRRSSSTPAGRLTGGPIATSMVILSSPETSPSSSWCRVPYL